MAIQVRRLGLFDELLTAQLSRHNRAVLEAILERSAGNPLYARFIARTLSDWLAKPSAEAPEDVIRRLPVAPGDLAVYYRYLLAGADAAPDAGHLAEHLALLDFAVTIDELTRILPAVGRRRLSAGLLHLRPILIEQTGGLFRIYHESLRRHVVEQLQQEGRSISALLHPVIDWLTKGGLFDDSRAYRFLLPLYRRASRSSELLDAIKPDFIARSIVTLHPQKAVLGNLILAAQVAAETGNFQALCSLAELTFSTGISYEEKLADLETYASTAIELYGRSYLADRLLFDGKPVYDRAQGLRLCSLIDDAGGSAPWAPFMRLERPEHRGEIDLRDRLAPFHGFCRLTSETEALEKVRKWLRSAPTVAGDYGLGIAQRLVRMFDSTKISHLTNELIANAQPYWEWFALSLAIEFSARGDKDAALHWGTQALAGNIPPKHMARLIDCGVSPDSVRSKVASLKSVVSQVFTNTHDISEHLAESYVALVRINADQRSELKEIRNSLAGEGWYRRWFRFVIDVAIANGDNTQVLSALSALAEEVNPFTGVPRAIDMHSIRHVVTQTIQEALRVLTPSSRVDVLDWLIAISNGTTAYLQGSPGGPFRFLELAECLIPFADVALVQRFEDYITQQWNNEYYELHAEVCLQLARLWHRVADENKAREYWLLSGRYLAAYGFHKDATIFHLIDGCTALHDAGGTEILAELQKLQLLTDRALAHSDGKDTRGAPGAWFEAVAHVAPTSAIHLLSVSITSAERTLNRRFDQALTFVLARSQSMLPDDILALLYSACPVRDDGAARLKVIERLAVTNAQLASDIFEVTCAAIEGDREYGKMNDVSRQMVETFARERNWPLPEYPGEPASKLVEQKDGTATLKTLRLGPFFPEFPTPLELLKVLRTVRLDDYDSPGDQSAFAAELAVHLERLRGSEGVAPVLNLCADFSRRSYLPRCVVLEKVAEEFEGRDAELTAEIYVLAWCGSMVSWGRFGGLRQRDLLERGFRAHRERALRRLAIETAEQIARGHSFGLSLRVVEALCVAGDVEHARAAWSAACDVTEFRLPKTGSEYYHFSLLERTAIDPETAGTELLGALMVHPEYERRGQALGAFAQLAEVRPDMAYTVMRFLMSRNSTNDDLVIMFELAGPLLASQEVPPDLQAALRAFVDSESLELSHAAARVLARGGDAEGTPRRLPTMISLGDAWHGSELQRADYGHRIREISRLEPKFPRMVADAHSTFNYPRLREIRSEQRDAQTSRSAPWVPYLRMHTWDKELLDAAIDQSLPFLAASLSGRGRWGSHVERDVLAHLLPDAACSASRARSRGLRPDVPLPHERLSEMHPLLGQSIGIYKGWLHYGFWERQFGEDREGEREGFISTVKLGVLCGRAEEGAIWRGGTSLGRWHEQQLGEIAHFVDGPVVQQWSQDDAAYAGVLLTLCSEVRGLLQIRPARGAARMDLVTNDGEVLVVYRCWRYHPYSLDYGPATSRIEGGVLLVRPDASQRIISAIGELQSIAVVEHKSVGEPRARSAFPPPILSEDVDDD
jgi:hypothetical protein